MSIPLGILASGGADLAAPMLTLSDGMLWYDAAEYVTSPSVVWPDKTGRGKIAQKEGLSPTPTLTPHATPNGTPAVTFDGTQELRVEDLGWRRAASSGELWMVVQSGNVWNGGAWSFGPSPDASHFLWQDTVYEDFGTSVRKARSVGGMGYKWVVYHVAASSTQWKVEVDGVLQGAAETGVPWVNPSPRPHIGRSYQNSHLSSGGVGNLFFTGQIAEIYLRETVSSSGDAKDIRDYLTYRHLV